MDKSKYKTIFISTLNHSGEEGLPILILKAKVSILAIKEVAVAMIYANTYRATCKLKGAQVFAISIRDLEYQVEKEVRPESDPKSVISKEYYNLLYVFSKKNSYTLLPYRKYDHQIILKEE